MKVTLIHNPKAGEGETADGEHLVELVRAQGHDLTYQSSKRSDWEKALEAPADLIAVAGGDGTVNKVVKCLVGRSATVTVLPTGTANNIAKSFGLLETPVEKLIAGWKNARRTNFDIGQAVGPWGSTVFVEGLGVGFVADMISKLDEAGSPEKDHLERSADKVASAQRALRERLQRHATSKLMIKLDGADLSGDYVLVEVLNTPYVGPNLRLAPKADAGDGQLDVVLVGDDDRDKLSQYLLRSIEGKESTPGLKIKRGSHLHIGGARLRVHIDDRTWPEGDPAEGHVPDLIGMTLLVHALDFLVPAAQQ